MSITVDAGAGVRVDDLLGEVAERLTALGRLDLTAAGDGEVRDSIAVVEAVRAQVESVAARLVGELDTRRLWADDGAQGAAVWLRTGARVERRRASRLVRLARKLRAMPVTAMAFAAGDISPEVVQALIALDNPRTADALRRDEADLVAVAKAERFDRFCLHLQAWVAENDPDGGYRDRPESRRFHASKTLGGSWALDGWLDPISGTTFFGAFERIERQLFDADWADARQRLGRDPEGIHELARTPAQRRADTLVEMALRACAAPEGSRKPQPLITIVAGPERFERMCETLDGTTLAPEEAAALLDDAIIERITFDGDDQPFTVSKQRTFRGALRRAIQIRDRECTHPHCDAPVSRSEVDHIQPSSWGGQTRRENGRITCPFHNKARHGHRGPPTTDPPP
jgi:hypothetical protein